MKNWMGSVPRTVAAVAATALGATLGLAPASAASAQVDEGPVVGYSSYPPALPDGCPDGPAALLDVRWTNSRGDAVSDLAALPVSAGERVTARWSGYAAGCTTEDGTAAIAVSLAAYDAGELPLDPAIDQQLLDGWSSCAAGDDACLGEDGRSSIELVTPTRDEACAVQFDLVIGRPLAVVGPNGSFYSPALRGDDGPNMLIAAKNYALDACVPTTSMPTSTVAPTSTSAPSTSAPSTSAPTTSAPTTSAPTTSAPTTSAPTTSAPTTTAAPTTTSSTPSNPSTTEGPAVSPTGVTAPSTTVARDVSPVTVTVPSGSQLPFTGAGTAALVVFSTAAVALGSALLLVSRREAQRR